MIGKRISFALTAILLSGCSHFMDRPVTTRTMKPDTTRVLVTYGNYKSGVWNNKMYCEGGQPDVGVGVEQSLKSALKVAGPKTGDATAANADAALDLLNKTAITALAGRSQTVLITRDLLFYNCLLTANGVPADSPSWARYDQTLALVKDIIAVEKAQAEANVEAAKAVKAAVPVAPPAAAQPGVVSPPK